MKSPVCSLNPLVDYNTLERPVSWDCLFGRAAPLVVEIGFGMGEVILRNARKNPQSNYLGLELHWERMYKAMKFIGRQEDDLENIRFLRADARVAFERFFTQKSIDHIYSLFPCPWPKKSHVKHRLFSSSFLNLLNSRLKDRGQIYVVTDDYTYYQWMNEEVDTEYFDVQKSSTKPRFDTKFERKWMAEGQNEFFELVFAKKKHFDIKVPEDEEMKSFILKEFNPEDFVFDNVTEDVSIILKDRIYDSEQKRLQLHFIVSEQHLVQNFWITIQWKRDKWRIYKSDGQSFLPTPGIAQALDAVYAQAKSLMTIL